MVKTKGKGKTKRNPANSTLRFDQRLVLFQYILSLFEVGSLEELAVSLKDPRLEGYDSDNVSFFYHQLTVPGLFESGELTADILLQYDQNIFRHTRAIRGRRDDDIRWKYFQYLSLLFTEIYLDRYFRDPQKLLSALNQYVQNFNTQHEGDQIKPYTEADLSKLAFWKATGSGKTLIMHVNILQFKHYLAQYGRERELNRIILLTPNEGLSYQHLVEYGLSGLEAEIFDKNQGGLFSSGQIEIIDINKLKEDMGVKTVAVDAFEGNNLLLVDEGHRGSSGEVWKGIRDRLCATGFSFEYSATFGQAMKAAGKDDLVQEYARCILFDYSYKFFYKDGYGKEYRILNLSENQANDHHRQLYLTACLLAYYQQLRLFQDKQTEFTPFLLEKPLWVFVGKSVTATSQEGKQEVADVVSILQFLDQFAQDQDESILNLNLLMSGKTGLVDGRGRDLFANAFPYLTGLAMTGEDLYRDVLRCLCNGAVPGSTLHLDNLKGIKGEIGICLGDSDYFGVINVGADKELLKLCDEAGLSTDELDFSTSLFQQINARDSKINILIGARKFSEGWSSWRVSTMGLLNVGRKEGSEIIQLFGRGVRLKGYNMSLKRSRVICPGTAPDHITLAETLNVFGVRAEYMKQFQEYLEEEGLPPDKPESITLPVLRHWPPAKPLKVLRVKGDLNFKKDGPRPVLALPPEYLKRQKVILNWYPRLQVRMTKAAEFTVQESVFNQESFTDKQRAFLDWDEIYFELLRYKNEKGRFNLHIPRHILPQIMADPDWYTLYITAEEMQFNSFSQVRNWQEIVIILLKKYCDRFYAYHQRAWELPNLEYVDLSPDDTNLLYTYQVSVDEVEASMLEKLKQLATAMEDANRKGDLGEIDFRKFAHHVFAPVGFSRHLFEPLLCQSKGQTSLEIKPVPLNDGEKQFVLDLKEYVFNKNEFFADTDLYLLRNQSGGRGLKFFTGNQFFEPDFILWLFADGKQYIAFIDPKGVSHSEGLGDPKIQFCNTVKEIENRLGEADIILSSFIVSVTPFHRINWWIGDGKAGRESFDKVNVLFQEDGQAYIRRLFTRMIDTG